MIVEIINWKEVVEQFGLVENDNHFSAKEISKQLNEIVNNRKTIQIPVHIEIYYSKIGESFAMFELELSISKSESRAFYEFTGTAN